jgi:nucleotide-binding universal stress UspA family protein
MAPDRPAELTQSLCYVTNVQTRGVAGSRLTKVKAWRLQGGLTVCSSKEITMYTHILIPTDGSELSKMALRAGVELAKALGAQVTVVTVTTPFHALSSDAMLTENSAQYEKHISALTGKYFDSAKKIVAAAGIPCNLVHAEHEHPYQAIIDTAQNRGCDVILMASHGRHGISAIVLGSETLKVLTHSSIPVIVYRQPHASIGQILSAS